jgi:hypothetical protein
MRVSKSTSSANSPSYPEVVSLPYTGAAFRPCLWTHLDSVRNQFILRRWHSHLYTSKQTSPNLETESYSGNLGSRVSGWLQLLTLSIISERRVKEIQDVVSHTPFGKYIGGGQSC